MSRELWSGLAALVLLRERAFDITKGHLNSLCQFQTSRSGFLLSLMFNLAIAADSAVIINTVVIHSALLSLP